MPYTGPGSSRPLPRFLPRRRGRAVRLPGAGQSLAQQLGTWGFAVRVYLSFDGPTTANPVWLEVTEFVDTTSITITRGRQDGLSDVTAGTCSLTADNSDGRWTPSNPNGAWFGLIRKGAWLRVDLLPPSGTVSTRFVGFITGLPTGWAGLYASTKITASDRFLLLGQAPQLPAMTSAEVLYDTSTGVAQATPTGPGVLAHYPLAEAQSGSPGSSFALAFGDISGNLAPPLVPIPWGSNNASYLNYIKAQGAPGPGFDGQSCVQFSPQALAVGTVLTTTVQPWTTYAGAIGNPGNLSYGVLELWLQTTLVGTSQAFACLWDPTGANAVVFSVDGPTGYLSLGFAATTANSSFSNLFVGAMNPGSPAQTGVVLNDGNWHYISIAFNNAYANGNADTFVVNIDGKTIWIGAVGGTTSLNLNTLVIGGGFAGTSLQNFTGNIAGASWILTGRKASNYPAHYSAGYNGFYAESVDVRIARAARYAGIPQPTSSQAPAVGFSPVPIYTPGLKGPWTNLAACIHQVGTQSIVGRQPLDVMREAARTENMPLYVSRDGYLTIQPATTRYNAASAWFVDAHDIDPGTSFSDDFTYLVNQITVTPNGGATQTVNGPAGTASQNKYGVYSQSLATASANTTDAANAALAQVNANADPVPRLAPLVIDNAATLATQGGVPAPAAMGVNSGAGYTVYLVTVPDPWQGTQVYQITVPAGTASPKDILDLAAPVTAGLPYSAQLRVRLPNAGANLAAHISLNWLNASGGTISTTVGGNITVTAGAAGYTQITNVNATAPAGAVNVTIRLVLGTSTTADAAWQADGLQIEQNTVATTWQAPGPGSPNLLTLDQASAGEGTPYAGGGIYGNAWYDALLATDISTVITVTGLPSQAPAASLPAFVEGYTETISAGQHAFSFSTSPQVNASVFQLDSPTLGTLDTPSVTLPY